MATTDPTRTCGCCGAPLAGRQVSFCSKRCADKARKVASLDVRFWSMVNRTGEADCWLWTGHRNDRGYGTINRGRRTAGGKPVLAHRLSWELHRGVIPRGLFVCHSCDNPSCVNPSHLFVGTCSDNNADMRMKGRHKIGSDDPRAKLTESVVREIRRRVASGEPQRHLADEFGVSASTVCSVVAGHTWKHVPLS